MHKFYLSICMMFVFEAYADGQVNDLTHLDSAKKRLEAYLLEADGLMESRGLIFRLSRADAEASGLLDVSEVAGIQIFSVKNKVQYSSNQTASPDSGMPERSESLWLNGKLKGKAYLVNSPRARGQTFGIERDPAKPDEKDLYGPLVEHMVVDPFGLPLTNVNAVRGTLSSIDNAVSSWLIRRSLLDEDYTDGKLKTRWISANKNFVSELVFEDKQGGMPTVMRRFAVDSNSNEKKGYITETRTSWVKSEVENDKWVPSKIRMTDSDQGGSRTLNFEFDFIEQDKFEEIVTSIDWKELFEGKNPPWYSTIANKLKLEPKNATKSTR